MHNFDQLFTYETCVLKKWGRKYYGCILLRDISRYYKGDHVSLITIDYILNQLWFMDDFGTDLGLNIIFKKYTIQSIIDECKWSYTGLDDVLDRLGLPLPEGELLKTLENVYNLMQKDYWKAAAFIQNQFKESISNPKYKMCRNRLLKEFEESGCITNTQV